MNSLRIWASEVSGSFKHRSDRKKFKICSVWARWVVIVGDMSQGVGKEGVTRRAFTKGNKFAQQAQTHTHTS